VSMIRPDVWSSGSVVSTMSPYACRSEAQLGGAELPGEASQARTNGPASAVFSIRMICTGEEQSTDLPLDQARGLSSDIDFTITSKFETVQAGSRCLFQLRPHDELWDGTRLVRPSGHSVILRSCRKTVEQLSHARVGLVTHRSASLENNRCCPGSL
jgi:hypothetical protein